LEIGIGAGLKRHGNDLPEVGALLTSSAINRPIRLKIALETTVVLHDEVWILPMSAELEPRSVVVPLTKREDGSEVHIQPDLLAIGVEIQASAHAAAQGHAEDFVLWGTEICLALNGRFWHDSLSRWRGIKVHVNHVLPALRVHCADTLPLRKPMEFPPKIKAPGRKDGDDSHNEHATKGENNSTLHQATKTSEARLGPSP